MMPSKLSYILAIAALAVALAAPALNAADMTPEDVVAHHLDSIGTADARAAAKTRIVQGKGSFVIRVGGSGQLEGNSALVSDGRKMILMVKLANNDYHGEQFVTDGSRVSVAATTSNHKWSDFGEFVRNQDHLVKEGLLGGELTTAWALSNLADSKAKLNFDGIKKVDGQEAYQLTYHSPKRDDVTIHMFFDTQNFHHIKTTYSIKLASGFGSFAHSISDQAGLTNSTDPGGADATQSAKQQEVRYTIEERFADFRASDGLTLPGTYKIQFTEELQNGTTRVYEWDLTADEVTNNRTLDPKNFQIK